MDVSRYDFSCQKILHHGLRLAKSHGHASLEIEHVASALLAVESGFLPTMAVTTMTQTLERHLKAMPRVFGLKRIEFSKRLKLSLAKAEAEAGSTLVTVQVLWVTMIRNSTLLRNTLAKSMGETTLENSVEADSGSTRSHAKKASFQDFSSTSSAKQDAIPLEPELDKRLKDYTIDVTALAQRGLLDPVIGRDRVVRRVIEILGRKKKNNPILLGEPGVGKSAVVEGLALAIVSAKVPESLKGRRVLTLDLGALLAGAKFRGEFEERLKGVIDAVSALGDRVVLFIDEIHTLTGTGNQEGTLDAANLLKPALARGELQCVGATTLDEYRRFIEKDRALERRFQPVYVDEPSRIACISILRGLKARYEIHHGVKILDEALEAAVDLAIRYISHRKLPDKAIDLIDEAASRMRLEIDSMPGKLHQVMQRLEELSIERRAIEDSPANRPALARLDAELTELQGEYDVAEGAWHQYQKLLEQHRSLEQRRGELTDMFEDAKLAGDFGFAAQLQHQERPLVESQFLGVQKAIDALQMTYHFYGPDVGAREIADVVAELTKIPTGKLLADEADHLIHLEEHLKQQVFGQSEALRLVAQALRRARTGVGDPERPIGVLLFLGPTGVGKTETAKAVATEIFGDVARMVRIDMTEYMEAHNVSRLIGAPPGYVGYGEGGELTDAVRHQPFSVVLFDEIEKAHPRVLDILLQIFDAGRLTDGRGRLVDFRNTVCIMTSNLKTAAVGVKDAVLRQSLSPPLRPEFVNRIDEVVAFRRLGKTEWTLLIERLLRELNGRLAVRRMRIVLGVRFHQSLIRRCQDGDMSGRAIKRIFEQEVADLVSDRILLEPQAMEGAWQLELDPEGQVMWTLANEAHRYLPAASS